MFIYRLLHGASFVFVLHNMFVLDSMFLFGNMLSWRLHCTDICRCLQRGGVAHHSIACAAVLRKRLAKLSCDNLVKRLNLMIIVYIYI